MYSRTHSQSSFLLLLYKKCIHVVPLAPLIRGHYKQKIGLVFHDLDMEVKGFSPIRVHYVTKFTFVTMSEMNSE